MKNQFFSRTCTSFLFAAAISVAVLAQQPATQIAPTPERLRQQVTYLASDALEGRRTGTPGANDAAHYIAGEFSRLGLRPATQAIRTPKTRGEALSRFLQKFPYVSGIELGKNNVMTSSRSDSILRVGEDWMPLGLSANGRIENAPTVFVGYGITATELNYNDYAGSDLLGKIAVALSGTPDGDHPHGQFARYEDVRWKAIAARNAGAKALVIIAREDNFKEDRLSRLHYDNSAGDAGLVVVAVSRQTALTLFNFEALKQVTGLEELVQSFRQNGTKLQTDLLKDLRLTIASDVVRHDVAAQNVIGILEGSDLNLKNEAIVIGAHYDHLGRGGEGSLAPREGEIHHGADDNASGVAGVLELARVFLAQRPKPRRTIVFVAFSGEEEGLLGSNYYVNHPVIPLANTVAMVNMDMIGRMKNRSLIIGGVGTAQEWPSLIEAANLLQGVRVSAAGASSQTPTLNNLPLVVAANGRAVVTSDTAKQFVLTLSQDGYGPSDHSSFYAKQVPVLFFWTGTHEDYHRPSDTADKINYEAEAHILSLIIRIVSGLDASDKRPTYTVAKSESAGRATGFRVYLGTIPNYADANDGLLLDGVRDDSPAAKAGLKAGDRIVKLAGREVHNVYDYTYALGELKAGQEYEVQIMRGDQRVTLKITPAPRKQ